MEKKSIVLKKRKFTILVIFTLICILLLSGLTTSISTSFYVSGNDVKENSSKFSDRFRNNRLIEEMNNKVNEKNLLNDLFNVMIHTKCGEVEKSKELNWIRIDNIDVDNDSGTGVGGKDIEIKYLIFPWIEFEPDIAFGAIFYLTIDRITEDIKNENFTVNLETTFGENEVQVGYWSPDIEGNEIPDSVTVTLTILYYPTQKGIGYKLDVIPNYDSGNYDKEIVMLAKYSGDNIERDFSIEFDPPIETHIEYKPTKSEGLWQYEFIRYSGSNSTVTTTLRKVDGDEEGNTTFVIDKLPNKMSFMLELSPFNQGGGELLYESEEMYDTELRVETDFPGEFRYAIVKNTPKRISAEWNPGLQNGFCSIDIESEGTDFFLKDSLIDPEVNLSINNLESSNLTATWNLSQPGSFTLVKTKGPGVDIHLKMYNWIANISAEMTSEYLSFSWYLDMSGFVAIDTNWDPVANVEIEIRAEGVGIGIIAEPLKAEDFNLEWTLSPLQIDWQGLIDPVSMDIYLFLESIGWIQIWGWW